MKRDIICTICPRGCTVTVVGEVGNTTAQGYGCKRGLEYATAEFTSPVRILTTSVKVAGHNADLLPVRSQKPIPKEKLLDCMEVIKKASVKLPVNQYDVVVKNICDTGVDIVATKDIK